MIDKAIVKKNSSKNFVKEPTPSENKETKVNQDHVC